MSLETASSLAEFLSSNLTVIYSRIFPPFFFLLLLCLPGIALALQPPAILHNARQWRQNHREEHQRIVIIIVVSFYSSSSCPRMLPNGVKLFVYYKISSSLPPNVCLCVGIFFFFIHSLRRLPANGNPFLHTHTQYSTGRKATPNKPDEMTTRRRCGHVHGVNSNQIQLRDYKHCTRTKFSSVSFVTEANGRHIVPPPPFSHTFMRNHTIAHDTMGG